MTGSSFEVVLASLFADRQYVQGRGLHTRLQKKTGMTLLEIKREMRRLVSEGYLGGVNMNGDVAGHVYLLKPLQIPSNPLLDGWNAAIMSRKSDLTEAQTRALLSAPAAVFSLDSADQRTLIDGLIALSSSIETENLTDPYITSAKHLLGSSKALDVLGSAISTAFGVMQDASMNRIQHVLTAGPDDGQINTVILVENMAAFSAFADSETRHKALAICSFGYGLSMEKLGERMLTGGYKSCPAVGARYDLRKIFTSAQRILFWGDLDREGLRMYGSLKSIIPKIRLSAAYNLMEIELHSGNSHPYGPFAAKSTEQRHATLDDPDLLPLFNLVKDRAIDQEAICNPWPGEIILQPYNVDGLKPVLS